MNKKPTGSEELTQILHRAEKQMWLTFEDARAFQHSGNRGDEREEALIGFLNSIMPGRFKAVSGETIDLGGRRSGQIDVMVYDCMRDAPFYTGTGGKNGDVVLPVEALLAVVEVKSKLTKDETAKAVGGIHKIRKMRPGAQSWARYRPRGEKSDNGPRLFSTIFAYESDHGANDWSKKELRRVREEAQKAQLPCEAVDRVVVLNRGLLMPADGISASTTEDKQVLSLWFSSLINFLCRESGRRESLPWSDYGKQGGLTWEQTLPADFSAPKPETFSKTQVRKYVTGRK